MPPPRVREPLNHTPKRACFLCPSPGRAGRGERCSRDTGIAWGASPTAASTHTRYSLCKQRQARAPPERVYLLRIALLDSTAPPIRVVCSCARPATTTTATPPIWANHDRTKFHTQSLLCPPQRPDAADQILNPIMCPLCLDSVWQVHTAYVNVRSSHSVVSSKRGWICGHGPLTHGVGGAGARQHHAAGA
jgi:hypothetical protein